MNRTVAPYGETLGLMNPLSRRSFNYSFNSLSSAGAILYGRIEIGCISGRRSIPKSISLSRGTPRRSSRNTSRNSLTTKNDSSTEVHKARSDTDHCLHWKWRPAESGGRLDPMMDGIGPIGINPLLFEQPPDTSGSDGLAYHIQSIYHC
ncbi:hypothetical protein FXO37_09738 [Capsicum annuum]|nr:hypothetical protein FXO37_09738 [Capsicum annuum]